MDRVTVFIKRDTQRRQCEYGDMHTVSLFTRKFLYPTGDLYLMDNGYEKRMMPVYRDAQGREWRKHQTIDYSNNTYYVTDNTIGWPRLPHNGIEVSL